MARFLVFLTCILALLVCNSCLFTSSDDDHEDTTAYLSGTVKDADGNPITDALVYIVFDNPFGEKAVRDSILPFELSSFTAVLTAQNFVQVTWVTQSETNALGFNVLRSDYNNLTNAEQINSSIIQATNTSQEANYSFIDDEVLSSQTYYYWLQCIDMEGYSELYGPVSVTTADPPTPPVIPTAWVFSVYPNPFDNYCTINLAVKTAGQITLDITSVYLGEVRTIYLGDKVPGIYRFVWDGKDSSGNRVCSGIYQAELTAKSDSDSVLYQKTLNLLVNDPGLNNRPAVYSTATGYQIPLQKYFQFGTDMTVTDESGNVIDTFTIDGYFTVCIKKAGYTTATRQVSLSSFTTGHKEDFILYPEK
jgi:hypothetical protein